MKKYNKSNGFYKHYNKKGNSCRIRVTGHVDEYHEVLIKMLRKDEVEWVVFPTSRRFKSTQDIIHHILSNLETNKTIFDITTLSYR